MTKNTDLELELRNQFKVAQARYIYFLLAISVSAIGYAVARLKIEAFNINHIAFGLAIISWASSFICGLKFIELTIDSDFKNFLHLKRERLSRFSSDYSEASIEHKEHLYETSLIRVRKQECFGRLQQLFLMLGMFSYISWYALMMLSVSS